MKIHSDILDSMRVLGESRCSVGSMEKISPKLGGRLRRGLGQSSPMSPSMEASRMHSGIFLCFSERLSKGNAGF